MKKFVLAFTLLLLIGATGVQAQTVMNSTRSRTMITDDTTTTLPVTTTAVTAQTLTPTTAVTSLAGTSAAGLTKGGMPVSGSAEMTIFLTIAGLAVMGFGAFRAIRR